MAFQTVSKKHILSLIVLVGILITGVLSLCFGIVKLVDLSSAYAFLLATSFTVVFWWGFGDSIENKLGRRTNQESVAIPSIQIALTYPEKPVLSIEPLPHFKGRMIMSPAVVEDLGDGRKTATMTNDARGSTDEYRFLQLSQQLHVFWGPVDQPLKELVAKFGVVRIRCLSGDVSGCKIEGRCRVLEQFRTPLAQDSGFNPIGYFNWYSIETKRLVQSKAEEIDQKRNLGLNAYLKNIKLDLHQGDEKDLLLFYMIEGLQQVFMCTSLDITPFSLIEPITVQLELSITGEKYPKTVSYFHVKASWDNYVILRL